MNTKDQQMQERKYDAEWQQAKLSWIQRLQLRLFRKTLMAFAVGAVTEAYSRNIIDSHQMHEVAAIMNRRISQEVQP
jgi:hypothetical protein